ncbi:MAG: 50S ribosomal protein L18 [bacterium]
MLKELRLKRSHTARRSLRTRASLHGTAARPRLSVYISLQHVSAQMIDDDAAKTLLAVTTEHEKTMNKKTMTEKAIWVGEQIATKAAAAKIEKAVFDRGAKQYHGRMAALADAARAKGLEI